MVPNPFVRLRIDCEVPKLTASEMVFPSVKAMKEGGGLIVKLRRYEVTKSGILMSYKLQFAVVLSVRKNSLRSSCETAKFKTFTGGFVTFITVV